MAFPIPVSSALSPVSPVCAAADSRSPTMALPLRRHRLAPILVLVVLAPLLVAADLVLEDSYTVTTAADLDPHSGGGAGAHPYALLPRPRAGDLVLLDSAASALYTLPLPPAGGGGPLRLAGGGRAGYSDGGPGDAAFDRPRSVAVDGADNVYVADRIHGAVRKVAPSGFTTTIAGGHSSGPGRRDGPAQNATFSPDFELVYVPKICALLVADRGNRLIRQINLKPEDCAHETLPGLGNKSVSIIAILCALLGSVAGFLVRHFYPVHGISINHFFSRIQKQYKIIQRRTTLISFCDIKSAAANSLSCTLLLKLVRVSLGYLTVVFPSVRLAQGFPYKRPSRHSSTSNIGHRNKALAPSYQLGDLVSFDGDATEKEDNGSAKRQESEGPSFDHNLMELLDIPNGSIKKIDSLIKANLSSFSDQEECCSLTVDNCYSVSRRRLHGDKGLSS